jgi:hypothetical protein
LARVIHIDEYAVRELSGRVCPHHLKASIAQKSILTVTLFTRRLAVHQFLGTTVAEDA